eukprot:9686298-Prorocentrum_lima.AAC.1
MSRPWLAAVRGGVNHRAWTGGLSAGCCVVTTVSSACRRRADSGRCKGQGRLRNHRRVGLE